MIYRIACIVIICIFCFLGKSIALSYDSVIGKINPQNESDFLAVAKQYKRNKKDPTPLWMRTEGYIAFLTMAHAAKKDGVTLEIVSARRSYEDQIPLFLEFGIERALPPGTSSHHYGNAIDLAGVLPGTKTEQRLQNNAKLYGFCQSYDGVSSGQGEEPRHYEYSPGVSRKALATYWDQLYLELTTTKLILSGSINKQELFDKYIFPYSHRCIDNYPSRVDDVITGIRFERFLETHSQDLVNYSLKRYKSLFGDGLASYLPQEIRFIKSGGTLAFAPLSFYPLHLQKAFRYHERFRTGIERLVLVRLKAHLMQYDEKPAQ